MNKEIIKDILSYYFSILEEATSVLKDASIANINRMYRFPNNNDIKTKYYSELKEYFKSIKIDLNVIKFLISNYKYLDINDIYYTLDKLDITAEEKFFYIDSLIELLNISCDLELEDKFYIPKKKYKIKPEDYYLNIAKGFSMNSVKSFLIGESIYDEESFEETKSKIKYFNLVGGDTKYIAGVFDKGIVLPRVRDDLTTLIAIHELVHYSILDKKDIIKDNNIVYSEILPRFYENLYASQNGFIKDTIHKDEYTDILLNDYHEEPMMVQVEKVRRLIN